MINCIIIDDETPAINVLKRLVSKIPELNLLGVATSPLDGLRLIEQLNPDAVFLDIQMGEMDGIELARMVEGKVRIVFCTAHVEYAVQSYEVNAVDYLLKPIQFPRFKIAVQKLVDSIMDIVTPVEEIPDDYILVKQGDRGKLFKIDIDDIRWVKAWNNYVQFYCNEKKITAYASLKELETRLPATSFIRVHKSYIVAVKQIQMLEGNLIAMKGDGHKIPIGGNYKASFLDKIIGKLI